MKLFNKLALLALATVFATSCAVHDPFADRMELGQVLPTVSWELGSSNVKAGSSVSFKGKYYTSSDREIDHSEVWGMITRNGEAKATSRLTTKLSYTKTVTTNDTVRTASLISSYPHSMAEWDGYEYILTSEFPVSGTLAPVQWANPTDFDEAKFAQYYPATFQDEFKATIVNYLTKDSTYYDDLRNVYIKYDFTAEQFEQLNAKYGLNMPTVTESSGKGGKSDQWYVTDEVDHYYYITVDEAGVKTEHEIATKEDAPASVPEDKIYEVYKSSPWVFSRYNDDTGSRVNSVRREYMPYWKELIEQIPFTSWVYNTTDKNYSIDFTRRYVLVPYFRVYDTEGKMGTDTETKQVEIN